MIHHNFSLPLADGTPLVLGPRPLVMGILNVTPDSFSDGGHHTDVPAAVAHAQLMQAEGCDIIDVGGESTRPGAEAVGVQAELDRVLPVLDGLREAALACPLSIDTYKAVVADQAIQAGAGLINDVHGFQREPEIADVAALYGVPLVAMHWDTERDSSKDLIWEMHRWFERSIAIALKAGVQPERIVLDPGFGFAKSLPENYEILRRLPELADLGFPLLVGMSRKSMFGKLLDAPVEQRVHASVAAAALAYAGGAHIFRVHDVRASHDGLKVAQASLYGPPPEEA